MYEPNSRRLAQFLLSLSLSLSLILACNALGAGENWVYVSNMIGSDTTGDGSPENPYETFEKAVTVGGLIKFLPNAPNTPYPIITLKSTMPDLDYKIVAEEGPLVTRAVGLASEGFKRFHVIGFYFSNPDGTGVNIYQNDAPRFSNCIVAYCSGSGMYITDTSVKNWSFASNCVFYSNNGTGIMANTGDHYMYVKNCIFAKNNGYGIYVYCQQRGTLHSSFCCFAENVSGAVGCWNICPTVAHELSAASLTFVNPEECDFRLRRPPDQSAGLFHQGDPAIQNPDGSRSDPGAFGGPDAANWFYRGPGTRPVISSVTTDKSDEGGGKMKVKVRVRVAQ